MSLDLALPLELLGGDSESRVYNRGS